VLPRMAVSGSGARDGLAVRALQPRLARQLAVVTRRDKPVGRGLRQVLDMLLALAGDLPGAAGGKAAPGAAKSARRRSGV